jgi:mRNA interferase HigB
VCRLPRSCIHGSTDFRVEQVRDPALISLPNREMLAPTNAIARSSLQKFWERLGCADARGSLHSWCDDALQATWRSPQDAKDPYASAGICGNNRLVFNMDGNKYRLQVQMQYRAGIVWVKFMGAHAQYDGIDVENVNEYQADPQ